MRWFSLTCLVWILSLASIYSQNTSSIAPLRFGIQQPLGQLYAEQRAGDFLRYAAAAVNRTAEVVALITREDVYAVIQNNTVDYLIAGVTLYNCLSLQYPLSLMGSVSILIDGVSTSYLGGLIVVKTNSAVQTLRDVKGRTIGLTELNLLGATVAQWYELEKAGVSLYVDCPLVMVMHADLAVLTGVISGLVEVGFIRAGQLGQLSKQIDESQVRILNPQTHPDFPSVLSTPVYISALLIATPRTTLSVNTEMATALYAYAPHNSESLLPSTFTGCTSPGETLSVLQLQYKLGLIKTVDEQTVISNVTPCVRDADPYSFVVCPTGYNKLSRDQLDSCGPVSGACPTGYTCICSPCQQKTAPKPFWWIAVPFAMIFFAIFCRHLYCYLSRRTLAIPYKELNLSDASSVLVIGANRYGRVLRGSLNRIHVACKRALPKGSSGVSVFDNDDMLLSEAVTTRKIWYTIGRIVFAFPTDSEVKKQELDRWKQVAHPNIVPTLGFSEGPSGNELILVTPYFKYGSLHAFLGNCTVNLETDMIVAILRDVIEGLKYMSSLSPPQYTCSLLTHHILIDNNFRVLVSPRPQLSLHNMGSAVPPEFRSGQPVPTEASLMFNFGMLMYQVLYRNATFGTQLQRDFERDSRLPSVDPQREHDQLHQLMRACWTATPRERPSFEDTSTWLAGISTSSLMSCIQVDTSKLKGLMKLMLPVQVIEAVKQGRRVEDKAYDCVSIAVCTIQGVDQISSYMSLTDSKKAISYAFGQLDEILMQKGLLRVATVDGSYLAVGNLHVTAADHATRVAQFALEAIRIIGQLPIDPNVPTSNYMRLRVGMHCGPVIATVLGSNAPRFCLLGDSVCAATRVEQVSEPSCVLLSDEAALLVSAQNSKMRDNIVQRAGTHRLSGKGQIKTSWLIDDTQPLVTTKLATPFTVKVPYAPTPANGDLSAFSTSSDF